MSTETTDKSLEIYREKNFEGKSLLATSVATFLLLYLVSGMVNFEKAPPWANDLRTLIAFPAYLLYFLGFWKATKSKGYSPLIFLTSLIPIVGLVFIYYIPTRHADETKST